MSAKEHDYTISDGNVFADIGLSDSEEWLAKASLAHQIASVARGRHLNQTETARILGTTQPTVSDLFAGRLTGFSMERLIRFLNSLDRDVQIVVTPKPRSRQHATLRVLAGSKALGAKRVAQVKSESYDDRLMEA